MTINGVESDVQDILDILSDANSRRILDEISAGALTANEISDACNTPLSTTYRKIDELTHTGLVEQQIRHRRSGKHASEYVRAVDDIVISLSNGETKDSLVLDLFG